MLYPRSKNRTHSDLKIPYSDLKIELTHRFARNNANLDVGYTAVALLVVSFFSPASGSKFLRPEFHADAESGLRTWLRSQIEACTSHF